MSIKKIDNYRIRLNQILGVNADTYLGYNNLSKEEVVIKSIPKNQIRKKYHHHIQSFKQEIKYLHKIRKNASFVVRYFNLLETTNHFYIILQFCKSGNLKKVLSQKRLSVAQSFKYMRHILKGFIELIKKGILHGNLHPQNILFHNGLMRLADFGCNFNHKFLALQNKIKNTTYLAPQVLQGKNYTQKSDIWSLGFIFYQMLYGYVPWKTGKNLNVYLDRLNTETLQFPSDPQISIDLKLLIKGCLQVNPAQRFQWEDIFSSSVFSGEFSQMLNIDIKLGYIIGKIRHSLYESNLDLQRFFESQNLQSQSILNENNFSKMVLSIDPNLQKDDASYLFRLFDSNHTKTIEFSEFKNALQNFDVCLQFQPLRKRKSKKIQVHQQNKIFSKEQILQNALLKLVYQIKQEKIYDIYEIFIQNDTDMSGILDFRQLSKLLRKIEPRLNDQQCRLIYKKMDINNDNQISLNEFMKSICIFTGSLYKQPK